MPILNARVESRAQTGETVPAPESLAGLGPVIEVMLALPDNAQRAHVERGEESPASIKGLAMIDTGASTTCFDADAAKRAGLPTVGVAQMTSASHTNHQVPTFAGKIVCPTITINLESAMGANLSFVGGELIALLGRDVLRTAVLIYNGPDGHFSLAN